MRRSTKIQSHGLNGTGEHAATDHSGRVSSFSRVDPRSNFATAALTLIYEPESHEPVLDIILIHGLQGHPFNTWAVLRKVKNVKVPDDKRSSSKLRRIITRTDSSKSTASSASQEADDYIFWPADFLPHDCPRARILVYGYETAIAKHQFAGSVNKNSIFTHSKNLANEVARSHTLGRPIQFVAHSLGGIVVKETLAICSTSNSEEFKDILRSTVGVMFLGTPHRGSPAAGIGEIARKAASALLMDTNHRVLESLSLKNSDLERCQEVFSSLWHKHQFEVKTFQESLPLKLPFRFGQSRMEKVVPDISSCLGDSRERAETLDGDHRSMCRYTSAQGTNYKKVAAALRSIYTGVLEGNPTLASPQAIPTLTPPPGEPTFTIHEREILEHFKFRGMFFRQLSIAAPEGDTCRWLSDSAPFKAWADRGIGSSHPGLLQITGKPGSGKSTIMNWAFEAARSQPGNGTCVVGHFFNRRGQALEHSAMGMFFSILYQLGTQHPQCLGVFSAYERDYLQSFGIGQSETYLEFLKSRLRNIFSGHTYAPQKTIMFVDALDECNLDEASQIGYFLASLAELADGNLIQLGICISKREYPSLTVLRGLKINMEAYNGKDIRQYISRRLGQAAVDSNDAMVLEDAISQRSNGIFLWVVLAIDEILKDIENGKNTKYILKRAASLPKELEDLFAQVLEQVDPEDLRISFQLFQWAVLPTDRLRIREWHHILALLYAESPFSLRAWKESDHYIETDTQLERRIRDLSKGLIETKTTTDATEANNDTNSLLAGAGSVDSSSGDARVVQPIHETVADFFTSGNANSFFHRPINYDFIGSGQIAIATACLEYVGMSEFDELVIARRREAFDTGRRLRHYRSTTSFMSSASSHSTQYRYEGNDGDDDDKGKDALADTMSNEDMKPVEPKFQSSEERAGERVDEEFQPTRSTPESFGRPMDSGEPDNPPVAYSNTTQMLEEYPALASFAINRVFVHAHAAAARGADPDRFLEKLVKQDYWSRWHALQEDATDIEDCRTFLRSQGLSSWADLSPWADLLSNPQPTHFPGQGVNETRNTAAHGPPRKLRQSGEVPHTQIAY